MKTNPPAPQPAQTPLETAMLIYPGMTLLDMAAPQLILGLNGHTHLVWKRIEPVISDTGVSINPSVTYGDCRREVDVLFVPGATDNHWLMKDEETIEFLREVGRTARYITSVCTGSLLLGAAGLLDGRKSACHWAYVDILRDLGVEACDDRVVRDGRYLSGGGVTAGIDFGLSLLAELRGEAVAKMIQLGIQYSPEPPFVAGLPHEAGPDVTAMMKGLLADTVKAGRDIAREVVGKRSAANK